MTIATATLINAQADQILDYNAVGVTFGVPKPVITQNGVKNMTHVIDGVAVVNRDYNYTIDYDNYPDFYNAFVTSNITGVNSNNGFSNGFKPSENKFRMAVRIPNNEKIRFVEMSPNSIFVVSSKVVGPNVVETARWSNDPYLTDFTFSVSSSGKTIITNTYSNSTGISTPLLRMGRPVRNNTTTKWYIPIEYNILPGGVGRIYELDETNGTVVALSSAKIPGGYQIRLPDTITTANKATYLTLQGGIMYPSSWTWRQTINNPSMFYWKGKMLMVDNSGNLNYNTTDMITWQIIPAPPTGAMFYIVDRTDNDSRLIAVGLDSASSYNKLFIYELRAINGSWVKVGTINNGGFAAGYTGKILSANIDWGAPGASSSPNHYTPNLNTNPMPIPHLTTMNLGGLTSFQYWYPSGTVSINTIDDGEFNTLSMQFAYYHTFIYNGGPGSGEVGTQVRTDDTYPLMITATLGYPEDNVFDVNNTDALILRKQIESWAVVPTASVNINTSYINLRGDYGMLMGRKHFAFDNGFTHFLVSGTFPINNNNVTTTLSDWFKFIPTYKDVVDFPAKMFPLYEQKLLGRRAVYRFDPISAFYIDQDFDPPSYFTTHNRNDLNGKPVYRAFSEMLDPTILQSSDDINGTNNSIAGISATGTSDHVMFSGPMAETIGISTPSAPTNIIWILGSNLNRREPFTLDKLADYNDPANVTLFTIVG